MENMGKMVVEVVMVCDESFPQHLVVVAQDLPRH